MDTSTTNDRIERKIKNQKQKSIEGNLNLNNETVDQNQIWPMKIIQTTPIVIPSTSAIHKVDEILDNLRLTNSEIGTTNNSDVEKEDNYYFSLNSRQYTPSNILNVENKVVSTEQIIENKIGKNEEAKDYIDRFIDAYNIENYYNLKRKKNIRQWEKKKNANGPKGEKINIDKISQHTYIEPELITFDAYINKKEVEEDTDIGKIIFIREYTKDYGGFISVEWDKESDKTKIIVKFNSYQALQSATKRFNRIAAKVYSRMRLTPKTYYKIGSKHISSREFKILEVPIDMDKELIEQAIRKILKGQPFYVKDKCFIKNKVLFTLKDENACNLLKDIWLIEINNDLYRLTLGYFQKSHIEQKNHFVGKFLGFVKDTKLSEVLDILIICNAKNAYKKTDDDNIYVKFLNESDMINAYSHTFYKGKLTIKGAPRETKWSDRSLFLKSIL
jgi:hypothetical protein